MANNAAISTRRKPAAKITRSEVRALDAREKANLRLLFKSQNMAAIASGFHILESLEATEKDWKAVFDAAVFSKLITTWDEEVWQTVAEGLIDRQGLYQQFEITAVERFGKLAWLKMTPFLEKVVNQLPSRFDDFKAKLTAMHVTKNKDYLPAFMDLRKLPGKVARELAKHDGDLELLRVKNLSEEAAAELAKHQGSLDLYSLHEISPQVAGLLGQHKGKRLHLNGLRSLSEQVAAGLAKHSGTCLDFEGLNSISEPAARALAKYRGILDLSGLTSISYEVAVALAKHQGGLILMGLTGYSDQIAGALARTKGELSLYDLGRLEDSPGYLSLLRKVLKCNSGVPFHVGSLRTLTEKLAREFAKATSDLCFTSLEVLPESAAVELAEHQGRIAFDSLRSLSDGAAKALAKHRGDLSFGSLVELSEEAAKELASVKKQGNGQVYVNRSLLPKSIRKFFRH
jgi:hypothetical protein